MSGGVSNRYVAEVMHATSDVFRGVYPSDYLPRRPLDSPNSLIINLAPHSIKRGHFVCLYQTHQQIFYFDPLGFPPWVPAVQHFIERSGKHLHYNTKAVQPIQSSYCGFYCMAFLLWFEKRNKNMNDFISVFHSHVNNDTMVIKMLNTLIWVNLSCMVRIPISLLPVACWPFQP